MDVSFETARLSDGTEENRRYENGVLVQVTQHRKLPSGTSVLQRRAPDDTLLYESYSHGMRLMLTADYVNGTKSSETYIGNGRLLTRKGYEKARLAFPDMPAADATLVDHGAEAAQLLREERRIAKLKAATHAPDPERARKSDAFCESLLAGDSVENAYRWLDAKRFTLGEMNATASRRYLAKFKDLLCPRAWACEVSTTGDGNSNTGNLVVELPGDASNRAKVLDHVNRIVQNQGFDPELENGQRYCYVKLD